jgi:3-oxoadipate enol-lactonase
MQRGFLERPDCRIYYEVAGKGPFLVFAHGLGGNHLSWWQQIPHFSPHYTCVTFAHRGFAPSSMPPGGPEPAAYLDDLTALIDHVGATDVRIIGQSMGGWSALALAFAQPERVRALVLTSTGGGVAWPSLSFADADRVARWQREADSANDLFARGGHPAAGVRMAREQPAMHHLYREIDALSLDLDKLVLRQRLAAAQTRPVDDLRALEVPTLWLTGAEDIVFPPFAAEALSELMPQARLACVRDAGHSVYFERPDVFNRIVEDFLSECG